VHTARKDFKRLRSLLRLAYYGSDRGITRRENAMLREAGRRLSAARDATVLVETFDVLDPGGAAALREQLMRERETAGAAIRDPDGVVTEVLESLAALRDELGAREAWPHTPAQLARGYARVHRRARRALRDAEADPCDANIHTLRKRLKDVWYCSDLLQPAAPKRMSRMAKRAHKAADAAGEEHDFAVFEAWVGQVAAGDGDAARGLAAAAERGREDRASRTIDQARKVLARKPKAELRRVRRFSSWPPLETPVIESPAPRKVSSGDG